jgi:hypothetical protein
VNDDRAEDAVLIARSLHGRRDQAAAWRAEASLAASPIDITEVAVRLL